MLFIDADPIQAADLARVDPEAVDVAGTLEIPLTGDGGIIPQATTEAADLLLAALQSFSNYPGGAGLSGNHMAAVYNTGTGAQQSRYKLYQVAVDNSDYPAMRSPIQTWMLYLTLALFYRSAANRKASDRYARKYEQYAQDTRLAWGRLQQKGIPVVLTCFPAPGAVYYPNAGIFGAGQVSAVSGAGSFAGTVSVRVCWVDTVNYDATKPDRGNAESGPSAAIPLDIPAGYLVRLDITKLTPPNGIPAPVGISSGTVPVAVAGGWNVFVSSDDSGVYYLQNSSPIPVATKTYTLAADPVTGTAVMRPGQYPISNVYFFDQINRA